MWLSGHPIPQVPDTDNKTSTKNIILNTVAYLISHRHHTILKYSILMLTQKYSFLAFFDLIWLSQQLLFVFKISGVVLFRFVFFTLTLFVCRKSKRFMSARSFATEMSFHSLWLKIVFFRVLLFEIYFVLSTSIKGLAFFMWPVMEFTAIKIKEMPPVHLNDLNEYYYLLSVQGKKCFKTIRQDSCNLFLWKQKIIVKVWVAFIKTLLHVCQHSF